MSISSKKSCSGHPSFQISIGLYRNWHLEYMKSRMRRFPQRSDLWIWSCRGSDIKRSSRSHADSEGVIRHRKAGKATSRSLETVQERCWLNLDRVLVFIQPVCVEWNETLLMVVAMGSWHSIVEGLVNPRIIIRRRHASGADWI